MQLEASSNKISSAPVLPKAMNCNENLVDSSCQQPISRKDILDFPLDGLAHAYRQAMVKATKPPQTALTLENNKIKKLKNTLETPINLLFLDPVAKVAAIVDNPFHILKKTKRPSFLLGGYLIYLIGSKGLLVDFEPMPRKETDTEMAKKRRLGALR